MPWGGLSATRTKAPGQEMNEQAVRETALGDMKRWRRLISHNRTPDSKHNRADSELYQGWKDAMRVFGRLFYFTSQRSLCSTGSMTHLAIVFIRSVGVS